MPFVERNHVTITYNRLYVVIFTLAVFAALLIVLKHTRMGLSIRAVSQNRAMAKAMGIRSEWVDAMTFGLGSGIAGIAGVALSQLTNVNPNLGQSYIIDSFLVVVFGGVGNLWGAMVGGMLMGVVDELLEPYSGAVLAKIFVLVVREIRQNHGFSYKRNYNTSVQAEKQKIGDIKGYAAASRTPEPSLVSMSKLASTAWIAMTCTLRRSSVGVRCRKTIG